MNPLESLFEKGIQLLCQYMGEASELSKPTIFHSIRVGAYLYERAYSREIVLAGLLHDIIEDTDIAPTLLEEAFGANVVKLILANSKDATLADQNKRIEELIQRCIKNGEAALIVKAADVIDNFRYFSRIKDAKGIDYCERNATIIMKHKPNDYTDPIFQELQNVISPNMSP